MKSDRMNSLGDSVTIESLFNSTTNCLTDFSLMDFDENIFFFLFRKRKKFRTKLFLREIDAIEIMKYSVWIQV